VTGIVEFLTAQLNYDARRAREAELADDPYLNWYSVNDEVTAKRKILALHSTPHTVVDGFCVEDGGDCTHAGEARCELCGFGDGCPTVRCMTEVYADRQGYKESWRP
jgi:hypothetical protein